MKKAILGIFFLFAIFAVWTARNYFAEKNEKAKSARPQIVSSYWTCPMHPQIHAEHAGECPICHMKLVQVKAKDTAVSETSRATVEISQNQLGLSGIQKEQVERMDLKILIPIAGRLISKSNVAFQVYESDLKYIKPGLTFTGTSSLAEEKDLSGKITSVDSIVDPTSRTVRVVGTLLKAPGNLISETTFSGEAIVDLKNRVSIPESSVLHTGTGDLVYIFKEGGELTARPVKLGLKSESFYEVLSGLEGGEFISSGPNFLIDSEAKIRGASAPRPGESKSSLPECPRDQHWDIPMSMCMPGKIKDEVGK
jgi:hypothetical protein